MSSLKAIICVWTSCFLWGFGKRTRRQATPLSNPKRRRLQQMAWNQARRTSSRSEPGQLLATGASAEDLSLKPAQCVSPSNYCQTVSLEPLPETSQGVDTFAESCSFLLGNVRHIVTVHKTFVWHICRCFLGSRWGEVKSGGLQAPEIHSVRCLEKSRVYESWFKRGE